MLPSLTAKLRTALITLKILVLGLRAQFVLQYLAVQGRIP